MTVLPPAQQLGESCGEDVSHALLVSLYEHQVTPESDDLRVALGPDPPETDCFILPVAGPEGVPAAHRAVGTDEGGDSDAVLVGRGVEGETPPRSRLRFDDANLVYIRKLSKEREVPPVRFIEPVLFGTVHSDPKATPLGLKRIAFTRDQVPFKLVRHS